MTSSGRLVAQLPDRAHGVTAHRTHGGQNGTPEGAFGHGRTAAAELDGDVSIPEGTQLTHRNEAGSLSDDAVENRRATAAPPADVEDPRFGLETSGHGGSVTLPPAVEAMDQE